MNKITVLTFGLLASSSTFAHQGDHNTSTLAAALSHLFGSTTHLSGAVSLVVGASLALILVRRAFVKAKKQVRAD